MNDAQVFGLSHWKDRVVIYWDGKNYKGRFGDRGREYQELTFGYDSMQFEKRNSTRTEPWVSPLFKGQGDEEEPGTETAKEELMI